MPENLTNEKSILVQETTLAIAWANVDPDLWFMSPYDVTRPQCVNVQS